MLSLELYDLADIQLIAKIIAEYIQNNSDTNCCAFYGSMGVGKTTLIKAICQQFEVKEEVTSPTFAIVNEYTNNNNKTIYHFDFYRINKIEEVYDFGYEEYFYSSKLCLIEWPEFIEELLPEKYIKINIELSENQKRIIKITNKYN